MVSTLLQGGVGNRLFMISHCIAHAFRYNLEYCIPKTVINPHYKDEVPYLFPNVNYCDKPPILTHYSEAFYHYQEVPRIDNVVFLGYWQSWKYFDDCRDEIIKAFGFDDLVTIPNICSLHYRFGDFKNLPTIHPVVSREYIIGAINTMISKGYKRFLVFSDDIPEIKEMIKTFNWYGDCIFEYSEGQSDIEDLKLMASCSSSIIANSSYSYWGAYINPNPNKIVVYPQRWFGESMSDHDIKDLCPKNWIAL